MKSSIKAGHRTVLATLIGGSLLMGCVTAPTGPAVNVFPGSRATSEQFSADASNCMGYAQAALGPNAAQPANDAAAANALGATLLGAAIGALFGAAGGDVGTGAAIGAGSGLFGGSIAAANQGGYSTRALQRSYDRAYLQCMYARGHQVPVRVAPLTVPGTYAVPPGAGYPPPDTPPPKYRPAPPVAPAYPPPNTVPPPSGFPAPGTPPPG
jgi:hypothetical protein